MLRSHGAAQLAMASNSRPNSINLRTRSVPPQRPQDTGRILGEADELSNHGNDAEEPNPATQLNEQATTPDTGAASSHTVEGSNAP